MKRLLFTFALILVLTACAKSSSTTSGYINVVDKGKSNKDQWIVISAKNETTEKIYVKDENTWNLIHKGESYFSSYKNTNNKLVLERIDEPGKNNDESK